MTPVREVRVRRVKLSSPSHLVGPLLGRSAVWKDLPDRSDQILNPYGFSEESERSPLERTKLLRFLGR